MLIFGLMDELQTWFDMERGNQSKLAVVLSVSPSTFSSWKKIPSERVLDIARFTGLPFHKLRADLYPISVFGEVVAATVPHSSNLDPSPAAPTVSQDMPSSGVSHG